MAYKKRLFGSSSRHQFFASLIFFMMLAFGIALPVSAQYFSKMSIKEKNFCDTIPIEFRRGRIFITVEIEGRAHQFTAAWASMIRPKCFTLSAKLKNDNKGEMRHGKQDHH